jgi:tRNA nucleotidyltransferase/poly(A) polymerase
LNFNIEETTWNAILENNQLISTVSGERIHHELLQLLKSQFYLQGLKLFRESGLEEVLFAPTNPQQKVSRLQWLRGKSATDHPEDEWLNWVYFFSDDAAYSTYLQRIRLSKKNQDLCKKALDFIFSLQDFFTLPLGQQLAQLMTQPYSEVLALLGSTDILLDEKWRDYQEKAQNLIQKKQLLQHPLPLLQFIHIAELPPGPLLKECLQQAYWYQLQHNLNNLQDMLNWFKNWRKDRI